MVSWSSLEDLEDVPYEVEEEVRGEAGFQVMSEEPEASVLAARRMRR